MAQRHGNVLPTGVVLEGYRIGPPLGAGGFGITYKAHDIRLDRDVAIKEYMPRHLAMRDLGDGISVRPINDGEHAAYESGLKAFEREGRTLVKFRHPNIVPALKLFDSHGTAYLVMDYVEGESLRDILSAHKTLPEAELRAIAMPLLQGLDTIHADGYIHRDIKPGNIFIRAADGSPVLLDFGAARQAVGAQSQGLTSIVTPGYAPIEQYSEQAPQGPWTDIYALGATLYRAITGGKPADAPQRTRDDTLVPARAAAGGSYSEAFLAAIDAALALRQEDRPQSAAEWRHMLDADATAETGKAKPQSVIGSTGISRRPALGRRLATAAAAAILVVTVVAGWLLTGPWFGSDAASPGKAAGIEIRKFAVSDRRPEMAWLRNKVERNLVELFNDRGMAVRSSATVNRTLPKGYHAIVGRIDRIDEDVSISVTLLNPTGTVVSSTELSAPFPVLRKLYKTIPQALVYGLDVNPRALVRRKSKERPTASLLAFAHYLMAQRAMRRQRPDTARERLLEAARIDAKFAMAYWSIGQIERSVGNTGKAKEWEAKAQAIDLDHPRWPFTGSAAAAKILPHLMLALRRGKRETIDRGIIYRRVELKADRIAFHAWSFAQDRYALRVATLPDHNGGSVAAFAKAHGALMAVNGGFFDIDAGNRLSASGLLVVGGVRLGEITGKGGSGVLLRRGGQIQIVWRRAVGSLEGLDDAVQSGPVIVEPGGKLGIRSNSFNRLPRSAICLTPGRFTVVVVTGGLSLYELAKVLAARRKDGGFSCNVALNLDGGPSTQAYMQAGNSSLHLKGLWKVHNAIVVRRR